MKAPIAQRIAIKAQDLSADFADFADLEGMKI
jgi:hypothetical protein